MKPRVRRNRIKMNAGACRHFAKGFARHVGTHPTSKRVRSCSHCYGEPLWVSRASFRSHFERDSWRHAGASVSLEFLRVRRYFNGTSMFGRHAPASVWACLRGQQAVRTTRSIETKRSDVP